MATVLGIFVKFPVAGHVKTRLGRQIGMEPAAALASAFQRDLFDRTAGIADRRIVACDPGTVAVREHFRALLYAEDEIWPQPPEELGIRLSEFFSRFCREGDRVIAIGSDSPNLPAAYLQEGFRRLAADELVLGPATDGGYYLIGQNRFISEVFAGIPWSTNETLTQTLDIATRLGVSFSLLPEWYDVDDLADLMRLHAETARTVERATDHPAATWKILQEMFPALSVDQ